MWLSAAQAGHAKSYVGIRFYKLKVYFSSYTTIIKNQSWTLILPELMKTAIMDKAIIEIQSCVWDCSRW